MRFMYIGKMVFFGVGMEFMAVQNKRKLNESFFSFFRLSCNAMTTVKSF